MWKVSVVAVLTCLSLALTTGSAQADSNPVTLYAPGWDLYRVLPGTQYRGVDFVGDAPGSFDFVTVSGDLGRHATGDAALIVQRPHALTDLGSFQIVTASSLTLRSARDDVDLGAGRQRYFLTASPITSQSNDRSEFFGENGKYDLRLDLDLRLRTGSPTGPVVGSDRQLAFIGTNDNFAFNDPSDDIPFSGTPPAGALVIPVINDPMEGSPQPWPRTPFSLHSDGLTLVVDQARSIPLPRAALAIIGALPVFVFVLRKNQRLSVKSR